MTYTLVRPLPSTLRISEDPFGGDGAPMYTFRDPHSPSCEIVTRLRVEFAHDNAWFGEFSGMSHESSVQICSLGKSSLIVVAGCIPYLIPLENPVDYAVAPVLPARVSEYSDSMGLAILGNFTDLIAIDSNGRLAWEARNLVTDGFEEVRLATSVIVIRGFYAPEGREVEWTLDLSTGTVISKST